MNKNDPIILPLSINNSIIRNNKEQNFYYRTACFFFIAQLFIVCFLLIYVDWLKIDSLNVFLIYFLLTSIDQREKHSSMIISMSIFSKISFIRVNRPLMKEYIYVQQKVYCYLCERLKVYMRKRNNFLLI